MIKLLWNTHNQNEYNPKENDQKDLADYNWGFYHKKNSDQWIFTILSKVSFESINSKKVARSFFYNNFKISQLTFIIVMCFLI